MSKMDTISSTCIQGYGATLDAKRIVSLWDMLQIDTRSFLASLTHIGTFLGEHRMLLSLAANQSGFTARSSMESRAQLLRAIQDLQNECAKHGLGTAEKTAQNAFKNCAHGLAGETWTHPNNLQRVITALEGLLNATVFEAESRQFYVLDGNVTEKHDDADTLFGENVVDAFPSAAFDISEAGKCLSFGVWTACVMHTMRVIESGVDALAAHVGVTKSDNWNKTLNDIETALRSIRKGVDGADAEQSAAEAGTHLRFIKNAWRNHAMHQLSKYDEREARTIFGNARSFMQHMAEMTAQ